MPSGGGKSKEDTWKTSELEKGLRESKDDRSKRSIKKSDGSDGRERKHRDESDRRDRERDGKSRGDRDREIDRERRHHRDETEKSRSSKHLSEEKEERRSHRRQDESSGAGKSNGDVTDKKHRSKEDGHHRESSSRDAEKHRKQDEDGDKKERTRDTDENRRHRRVDVDGSGEKSEKRRSEKDRERKSDSHKSTTDGERRERRDENGRDREKRSHHSKDEDGESRHKEKKQRAKEEERYKASTKPSADDNEYEVNYEDDFEQYEDDFDPDGGSSSDDERLSKKKSTSRKQKQTSQSNVNRERDEILRAIVEENDRLYSVEGTHKKSSSATDDLPSSYHKQSAHSSQSFIDFGSAKRRNLTNKAASKLQGRAKDLFDLIELETVEHSLFEYQPTKEYDIFIQSFGQSNAKQAFVQTNDDNIEKDVQTEEISTKDKWTQHPSSVDVPAVGGDIANENMESEQKFLDSIALAKFITKAGQVMAILLEENSMDYIHKNVGRKQSNIVVSEAFTELGPVSILEGRHCINSAFSSVQSHLMLAVYSFPANSRGFSEWTEGLVCEWNVYQPSLPQKFLVCHKQPNCCCFSPNKPIFAFAGLSDGSVVVWDLRESSSAHRLYKDENGSEYCLRQPTYNTAGVLHSENHQSPVISIVPISAGAAGTRSNIDDHPSGSDGAAFQLATLDSESVINLWILADLGQADFAGSLSDLGLRPGGQVQLIKSSKILLAHPYRQITSKFHSFDLQVLPSNNSHYFVATDVGCIIHGLRHGAKVSPKVYYASPDVSVKVVTIDFSPFMEPVFLAGCDDGSLKLFHVDCDQPLTTWLKATESNRPISLVRWCRSRPAVFFVLDSDSYLYIWDLNMDSSAALKHERISSDSRVTSLCLSNDFSATGQGLPGRPPQMVVFFENGTSEAHIIKKQFSALMADEVDKFSLLIQTVAA